MIAIFTVGADEIRIKQMEKIAEAWGFAGKYMDSKILLNDAKKKRFNSVLVMDQEALDDNAKMELKNLGIEIIDFRNKKVLEKKIL
ncbi:hypothetical protein A3K64_02520 [Candidatus Micrarchaeota archaeon RBG_16_36_9]|nr:MAG: hypothetical protein A3K64_02520 [Candidatus Micrarchaeota archaeon RBG_16_36_9]